MAQHTVCCSSLAESMSQLYSSSAMRSHADMDNFTPPPPPSSSTIYPMPPPLPPPPRDLPESYRATPTPTPTLTDNMSGTAFSRTSRDGYTTSPGSPEGERNRRGSFGFLSRSRSKSRDNVVTSPDGQTKMLRKHKVREQEERLRQQREARAHELPPTIPSHSPLPAINTFGGDTARPDSIAIISNNVKASNFSRPYQHNTMAQSTSLPLLGGNPNALQTSTTRSTLGGGSIRNGEYVDPQTRTESITSRGRYSLSDSHGNVVSPRRVRRRKDPTPFKSVACFTIYTRSHADSTLQHPRTWS